MELKQDIYRQINEAKTSADIRRLCEYIVFSTKNNLLTTLDSNILKGTLIEKQFEILGI